MAKYCILGSRGFIGSALAKKLGDYSWYPTKDTKVIIHLDSPVHPPYEDSPEYFFNKIVTDFLYLLPYCERRGIKFIYASSALVYEKDTNFAKQKKMLELMASMYPNTLGLRIFPVYGPGESRTVISQWCKQMKRGERPVVYGDGKQRRDFVFIDDVVDWILEFADLDVSGIVDIGGGNPVTFNRIIYLINKQLGSDLKPIYKKSPRGYSKGIVTDQPCQMDFSIEDGIKRILESKV